MSTFAPFIFDGAVLVFRNNISYNFQKKIDHAHLRTIGATSRFEGGGKLWDCKQFLLESSKVV